MDSDNDSDMESSNTSVQPKKQDPFTLKSSNAPSKSNSADWPLLLKVCIVIFCVLHSVYYLLCFPLIATIFTLYKV